MTVICELKGVYPPRPGLKFTLEPGGIWGDQSCVKERYCEEPVVAVAETVVEACPPCVTLAV